MNPTPRLFVKAATSTTSTASRLRKAPPISLDHFIQRQRVLALYRTIMRSAYRIPKDRRGETVSYARGEFERNKHVTDLSQIRYLLSTGKTEYESMARYIDEMAGRGG